MTAIERPVPFRHRLTGRQGRLAGLSALILAVIAGVVIGGVVLTRDNAATQVGAPPVVPSANSQAAPPIPTAAQASRVAYVVGSQAEADQLSADLSAADSTLGAFDGAPTFTDIYIAGSASEAQALVQSLYSDANMVGLALRVVDLRKN